MALTYADFQRPVVFTSITASSLRNQGHAGIVAHARNFMLAMDLAPFAGAATEASFQAELDRQTQALAQLVGSWGAARKALNIFLCEAFHNVELNAHYQLDRIGPYLEVALDGTVGRRLWQESDATLPRWASIRGLQPEINQRYQEFAAAHALELNLDLRVDLEILYWNGAPAEPAEPAPLPNAA
jgi:hypothetical protein